MDIQKVIGIVMADLAVAKSRMELDLERIINNDTQMTDIVSGIKEYLKQLAINELMIQKLESLIANNLNSKENG